METDRCPGCGAKVRPDSSWCSLCYQDLRPQPLLVSAAGATDAGDGADAPFVDAALEPEPADWSAVSGDDEIVDAELVGEDGMIIAPRSGSHDADPAPDPVVGQQAPAQPSALEALTWSCKCGEIVSFEHTSCPVCGGSFLGDLRDGNAGRHRSGDSPLNWLPESRQVRLAGAVFIAMAFAVLMTLLVSIFG